MPAAMSETRVTYEIGGDTVRQYTVFTLSLPPSANHMYEPITRRNKAGKLAHGKRWSDQYAAWRDEATTVVRGWTPPARRPLGVQLDIYIPRRIGRRADVEGYVKPVLDAVVGSRGDQYIDRLVILRHTTQEWDGWAEVSVEVL